MTTKRIVYERPDGGVSQIVPAPEFVQQLMDGGMTEAQAIEAVRQKDVPAGATKVEIIDASDLPSRELRNRWRLA